MQTILGARGTIGKLLARELTSYTDNIRLVSRHPVKINDKDQLLTMDLTQPRAVDKAVQGSEVVYLVVGFDYKARVWEKLWPALMRDTIDACLKHDARLVFFDNVYMYDKDHLGQMTEETPVNPPSHKGAVRRRIADMLLMAIEEWGLKAVIARSADFYGPGNETGFINRMVLKNIAAGKRPSWLGGADFKHSFTFTPDAARATALLGNTPEALGRVWHLPTDKRTLTGKEFTAMVAAARGNSKPRLTVIHKWMLGPMGLFVPELKEIREMMYQYDRHYFFDSSAFSAQFGFEATPYEEGIGMMWKEYDNEGK